MAEGLREAHRLFEIQSWASNRHSREFARFKVAFIHASSFSQSRVAMNNVGIAMRIMLLLAAKARMLIRTSIARELRAKSFSNDRR